MARRIICSEFDARALRIAAPLTFSHGFRTLAEKDKNWSWPAPHRGILDLVPSKEINENTIIVGGFMFEPSRKTALAAGKGDTTGRAFRHDLWSFTKGWNRHRGCNLVSFRRRRDVRKGWPAEWTWEERQRHFAAGHSFSTRKDNIKTIKGQREERVRETRRESRALKLDILTSLDALDRTDY